MIRIPFHPQYWKNMDRCGSSNPCIVCGRPITSVRQKNVHVYQGVYLVLPTDEIEARGDTGFYPVDNDCLRKHPEIKPYVQSDPHAQPEASQ